MNNNNVMNEVLVTKAGREVEYAILQSWDMLTFLGMAERDTYTEVWRGIIDGDTDEEILEDLFHNFNINHPYGYMGRSLSAGDIVVLNGVEYKCEFIGWTKLEGGTK